MSHIRIRPLVACFLVLSVACWVLLLYILNSGLVFSVESLKQLPTVFTLDMAVFGTFVKWGWRWKLFRGWLVPFPDLEGTWRGTYRSTWEDPATGKTTPEAEIVLVIRQTFLTIHCTAFTKELTSRSYSTSLILDEQSGTRKLVYMYVGDPDQAVRFRSQVHRGAAELEIVGDVPEELRGLYWTDRKSTGDLVFRFVGRDKATKFSPSQGKAAS